MHRNPKFSVPLADAYHHLRPERPHLAVILYTKSAVFWTGRDIPLGTPVIDDPDFMLTTDYRIPPVDRLGRPLYPVDLYPLKILTGACFLETVTLLACRDYKHASGFDRVWWEYLFDLADGTHLAGLINTDHVDPCHR
ncbi:hypothetical protein ASPWEDRAFT_365802 [Aspergillus wentii DTO 134E9]|uniref:Uncharacterized protein n=1 Tax=Aspergillus wentii DTO 134E9 TaxID=1073089 RepID=A0A1L9RWH7_ASPWE|nr:uncharacterized protein ASPWEDRAFT_365802 [Aspergillus wentii DTO 134E9]KAI9929027.1 hypothetical protein MW887_001422 [Aspergillus wentii]OJJ39282.1 hypothetical protein ASPWEDRAFT_365802 [Aspergillus wentii DTO 134E9]